MQHICFITRAFNRQDSLIVQRQGKSLVESGYRVSYILSDGLEPEIKNGIEMQSVNLKYNDFLKKLFSIHKLPNKLYAFHVANKAMKRFIKNFDADIYQINDFEQLPIGFKLKKMGKKVVYNLREYYPDFRSRKIKNKFLRKTVFNLIERYLTKVAKRFDGIMNCMPEMEDYIREVMPSDNLENVANFPVVNKDFSLTFDEYSNRECIISYFGTIYSISCQQEFLKAISNIQPVKYLLAGKMETPKLYEELKRNPAWEKVEFINGFKRTELPGIINRSIIGNVMKDFSLTETPEGSYSIIKIFESMEASIPILLSKVPLYEKIVEKYNCGICVDPRNPEEIHDAILYLINNKEIAYEMGQNGRKAVLTEYSWDSQFKNYLKVIEKIN